MDINLYALRFLAEARLAEARQRRERLSQLARAAAGGAPQAPAPHFAGWRRLGRWLIGLPPRGEARSVSPSHRPA